MTPPITASAPDEQPPDPLASKPTEVAHVIAALAPTLPEQAAWDLMRMLSHSLAAPSAAEIRQSRLGLAVQLVGDGTGEFLGVDRYETERARRRAAGEVWPAHSTLIETYGKWTAVVDLAFRLMRDGTSSGVPFSRKHLQDRRRTYVQQDVLDAFARCAQDIGGSPGEAEYHEWVRISRQLARDTRQPLDRFPGREAIRRLFGNFAAAMAVAEREAAA